MEMLFNNVTGVQSFIYDYMKDDNIGESITSLLKGLIGGVESVEDFEFKIEDYNVFKFCADEQLQVTYGEYAHSVSELKCPVLKCFNKGTFTAIEDHDWSHVDTGLESLYANEENGYMTTHFLYESPYANMTIRDIRVTGTYMPVVMKAEYSSTVYVTFSYQIRVDIKYNV